MTQHRIRHAGANGPRGDSTPTLAGSVSACLLGRGFAGTALAESCARLTGVMALVTSWCGMASTPGDWVRIPARPPILTRSERRHRAQQLDGQGSRGSSVPCRCCRRYRLGAFVGRGGNGGTGAAACSIHAPASGYLHCPDPRPSEVEVGASGIVADSGLSAGLWRVSVPASPVLPLGFLPRGAGWQSSPPRFLGDA